jgi:hypothetical protein
MAANVIVKQHIDNLLVTSTLAGAQSTLGIDTGVTSVVRANSAAWGVVDQAALNLKANRNNPSFSGQLSATGPVVINVNSSMNALKITQAGSGPALLVEDSTNPAFIITSDGSVGIGVTPTSKFEVMGNAVIAEFSGASVQDNGIVINNTQASPLNFKRGYVHFRNEYNIPVAKVAGELNADGSAAIVFHTTDTGDRAVARDVQSVKITGNGNVGIGVGNPTAKLHVNGNIIATNIAGTNITGSSLTLNGGAGSSLFIPTSAKVQFGNPGDNTDNFYIQRVNPGIYFGGNSELRICIGDDPQSSGVNSPLSSTYVDRVVIGASLGTTSWVPRIALESTGLVSSFGDFLPTNNEPLTATPSKPTKPEHLTTKDYVDQHRTPPGAIMAFAMSAAPTGWVSCSGQQVSRTGIFKDLFAAIGTTYGVGNGTTTFHLPDMRGEFVRGWDNNRGIDSGRAFASTQKGTITIVDPNLNSNNVSGIYSQYEYNTSTFAPVAGYDIVNINDYQGVYRTHIGGTGFGALETSGFGQGATRPRNIALHYCIKY